ncbi:MAG: MBL fold metallo-hydrolase [Aquabacterium sp.]
MNDSATTSTTGRTWRPWRGALAVTLALLLGLGACSHLLDRPLQAQGPLPDVSAPQPAAHPPAGLSFSVIHTAHSRGALEAFIVGGGSWLHHRQPAQAAVLVDHPRGAFLFDAGLGRKVGEQFAVNTWLDRQFFAYADVVPAADQLAAAAWPADRIRFIVPSHMHWDHVSGLPDFPDAEVWVRPQEHEHASHGHAPAFLQSQFQHVKQWRELRLTGGAYLGFEHSLDLYGDGAVVFVPLTGHTAGQVGMFLTLPSGRRYFFTGDVTWTIEGLRIPADRSWLLRQILHVDHDEAANHACILHIHALMAAHPEITVVPAHDENVLRGLPRFPQFEG